MKTEYEYAELLRAIAREEDIEIRYLASGWFENTHVLFNLIMCGQDFDWRIKPEKKPDFTEFLTTSLNEQGLFYVLFHDKDNYSSIPNLKLTFDGETKKLIKVEIINEYS